MDTQETLANYFEAFASNDPDKMRAMRTNAQKDSPADLYAIHQIASIQGATGTDPDEVSIADGQVTLTSRNGLGEERTTVYEDFEFDDAGRLITWSAVGSGPLEGRIQLLNGSVTSNGVKFRLLTAYETNAGFLAVTARITNKTDAPVDVTVPAYVNPRGRQIDVNAYFEPRPGAFVEGYMDLGNSKVGGTLEVQFDFAVTQQLTVE